MNLKDLKNYWFSSELMVRKIDEDTTMIYNPENGDMYELNTVSAEIVEMLQQHKTGDEILQILETNYDVDEQTILDDTQPLIERLIEMKLLKIEG